MRAIATVLAIFGLVANGEPMWKKPITDVDPIWKREFTADEFMRLNPQEIFHAWSHDFGRAYTTIEESAHRFAIWVSNLERISQTNSQQLSYKLRLNQFADLTDDEFRMKVHGNLGSCLQNKKKKFQKSQPK